MMQDDILAEIRRWRDDYAKRFNYNIQAMGRDIQAREKQGKSPLVSFDKGPRKPVETLDRKA